LEGVFDLYDTDSDIHIFDLEKGVYWGNVCFVTREVLPAGSGEAFSYSYYCLGDLVGF
jgi:hypothetical protein